MSGAAAMYDDIMAEGSSAAAGGGAGALGSRLVAFRKWLTAEANCTVHPSICIVNGEATDGTKNAPVLLFGPPPGSSVGGGAGGKVMLKKDCKSVMLTIINGLTIHKATQSIS